MDNEYKISLGVDVDVSDIQSQINSKAKDTLIPVKLDISNLGDIEKQIQSLGGIKGGIDIPLTIDANSAIKSAQQVGQKIGSSVTKQVQKTLNIDDIIDSEVLDLMKTFSIAGDKGSNAFKEIRRALVECRSELQKLKNSDLGIDAEVFDTSRAFDKVSDAIANQMRAVNSLGDEYIKLAKYMKNFNDPKKGNKVRVPDFIKQEQGDDYKSTRGTLGIAFNTDKGISFASFVEDLNHELGIAIDLTKGEEKAYEELVHKLRLGKEQLKAQQKSQSSLQASASTDEILAQNYINKNEIRDATESSIDYINAAEVAEKSFAQASTETANIVTQNEERIQQSKKQTADVYEDVAKRVQRANKLISDSAQEAIDGVSSKSIDRAFRVSADDSLAFKREMENLVSQWTNGKGELTDIKIDTATEHDEDTGRFIEKITRAQVSYNNELGETIKKTIAWRQIGTDNDTPVMGFVEVAGQYSKSLEKTKVQTDKFVKQQKKSVADLTNQINQLNRSAIDQNANRPIKDSAHLNSLSSKYSEITSAIQRMGNASSNTFDEEVSNVRTLISEYKSLTREFRNAENASSQMKGNDYESGRAIAKEKYEKFLADAKGFSVDTSKLDINSVTDVASLNKFTDALRVAKAELAKLKAEAASTKRETDTTNREKALGVDVNDLRRSIESLRKLSPEINGFKADIDGAEVTVESLLNSLNNINVQSDFRVARKNFESFTKAAQEAGIAVTETQKKSADKKASDEEAKKVNQAYKEIYDTRKRIGSLEVDLIGAEAKGDAQAIKDINDEIIRLKANLASLDKNNIGSKFTNEQKSSLRELRKQIQYNKKQAQNSVDYKADAQATKDEAEAINDTYNEIYNLKKKIGSLEVDLIKAEDTKDAKALRDEIERLKGSLSALDKDEVNSKFTDKQKSSLKELEHQNNLAKNLAQNKVDAKLESQIDKEETAKVKQEAKELESSFKELKRLATEMGKIDIELAGLTDVDKDLDKFNSLKRMAEELEVEFNVLREATNLNTDQIRELDQIFANTTGAVRDLNNEMAKSDNASELTSGLERLKSIAKEINVLKLDIFKFEDADNIQQATNRLNELENEASELRATLQQKFGITSFDEVDDIARQGKEALDNLVAKVAEAKAKLAQGIKLDIELGSFENEIDTMRSKFNSLSDANDELRISVGKVENAYQDMLNASKANTGDEVADRERLIEAEKKYAAALEKTNNLIKIQARADRVSEANRRLKDSHKSLELDMVNWLKKNSKAAKEYEGQIYDLIDALRKLEKEGNLQQIDINSARRKFNLIDKDAESRGLKGLTVFDQMKSKFKQYASYLSAAEVFMYAEQAARSMYETVKEIDTAMTGLYRVTDLTDYQYDVLFDDMISSAKEYGATLTDIINATTDWVRAGFDADTSLGLAEVTTMYQHISDLDYDTAAENLITAYNGFKDELNGAFDGDQVAAVEYIADIFNELDKQNCPLVV